MCFCLQLVSAVSPGLNQVLAMFTCCETQRFVNPLTPCMFVALVWEVFPDWLLWAARVTVDVHVQACSLSCSEQCSAFSSPPHVELQRELLLHWLEVVMAGSLLLLTYTHLIFFFSCCTVRFMFLCSFLLRKLLFCCIKRCSDEFVIFLILFFCSVSGCSVVKPDLCESSCSGENLACFKEQ